MVVIPPTSNAIRHIERELRAKHAELQAHAGMSAQAKSDTLIRDMRLAIEMHTRAASHMQNLHNALDVRHHQSKKDAVRDGKNFPYYLPIDTILRRALDGIAKDRIAVRERWEAVRAEADHELWELRVDDEEKVVGSAGTARKRVKREKKGG